MSLLEHLSSSQFKPKYVDLAQILLRDIAERDLGPGDRLSTEGQLVEKYKLSRVTVRQALELLEREGYVSRQRARGTFVERKIDSEDHFTLLRGSVLIVGSNEQDAHREEDVATATVLRSMEQYLTKEGFTVQILSVGRDPAADRSRLLGLKSRGNLEGILTIDGCLEPYTDLTAGVPVVASCSFHSNIRPWVGQDTQVACRELIKHLIERGHRDIAMVCGPWIDGQAFGLFARGYQEAFAQAGLVVNRGNLFHAYPGESLVELAGSVLSNGTRPSAVFCEDWRVCQSVIKASSDLDISVPGDLSLVGYGQNVLEITDPVPVTAYVPNTTGIGEAAVRLLLKIVDGGEAPDEPVMISGHIVSGRSVREREEKKR
jgi:DNA-binding LacI/PurR family transcriptional regulator